MVFFSPLDTTGELFQHSVFCLPLAAVGRMGTRDFLSRVRDSRVGPLLRGHCCKVVKDLNCRAEDVEGLPSMLMPWKHHQ